MEPPVSQDRRNFYDGGMPARDDQPEVPPDHSADVVIVLDRRLHPQTGEEEFALMRRIAYDDRRFGQLLVPVRLDAFLSDLTSVPALFTWLVPKTGAHLPAALLHDGLCFPDGDEPTFSAPEWQGDPITRADADRVFRDAMADTGTGVVRRWLVWAAVATATMVLGHGTGWSRGRVWWHRAVVGGTVGLIAVLGVLATLDLLDVSWAPQLRWMGERGFLLELFGGLAGAVVFPAVLALLWGEFRMAGWIIGIGLAVLLHVTVGLLLVTGAYWLVERTAARFPTLLLGVMAAVSIAALVLFLALLL